MAYLEWLEQSVAASLGDGSIGEPVAVRLFLALGEDHGELTRTLGAAVAAAGRWLREPLRRLYAHGSAREGQISALAIFGGRTALLSSELIRPGGRREVRLLVLCQRGSLTHDDEPGSDGLRVDVSPPAAQRETALIERSLREGAPLEG
jgi:hypothetical protein